MPFTSRRRTRTVRGGRGRCARPCSMRGARSGRRVRDLELVRFRWPERDPALQARRVMAPRVVITGVGVVDGHTSGVVSELLDQAEARRLSRVCQFAVAAARLALAEASLDARGGMALLIGTEFGDMVSTIAFVDGYLRRGPVGLSALLFPHTVMNTMAAATAIAVSAKDLSLTLNAPTVAGELAIARAFAAVRADAGAEAGDIAHVYTSANGDEPREEWERALLDRALAPHRPLKRSLSLPTGRHSGLAARTVATAASEAGDRLALVHSVARGGNQVAIVVAGPGSASRGWSTDEASSSAAQDPPRGPEERALA